MNRKMEPRALSAVADRVTSGGAPVNGKVNRQADARTVAGRAPDVRAPDFRGQGSMDDHEENAGATGGTTGAGKGDGQPQLDRPTQTRIGDQLRSMYAELMDQPVPDRFRALLDQLDDPDKKAKPDREDGR